MSRLASVVLYVAGVRHRRVVTRRTMIAMAAVEAKTLEEVEAVRAELATRHARVSYQGMKKRAKKKQPTDSDSVYVFEVSDPVERKAAIGARCPLYAEALALGAKLEAAGIAVKYVDAMQDHREDEIPTVPCVVTVTQSGERAVHEVRSAADLETARFGVAEPVAPEGGWKPREMPWEVVRGRSFDALVQPDARLPESAQQVRERELAAQAERDAEASRPVAAEVDLTTERTGGT